MRVEFNRPSECGDPFVEFPMLGQCRAHIAVGNGKVRPALDGALERSDRLVKMALRAERIAEIAVGLGKTGIELQRAKTTCRCFPRPPKLTQGVTEVAVHLGITGVPLQQLLISGDGFINTSQAVQRAPQSAERRHVLGRQR